MSAAPAETSAGHVREVVRGASVAFVLKVLGAGVSFLLNVAAARALGLEGAGVFFLALNVATIASLIGRVGLDNTLLRHTAAAAAKHDWPAVRELHRTGLLIAYTASGAVAAALFLAAPALAQGLFGKPELAAPLRLAALSIVPTAALLLRSEMLRALERIRDSQFLNAVAVPAVALVLIYPLARAFGVEGATGAHLLASVAASAAAFWLWQRSAPRQGRAAGRFPVRELLRASLPLFWVALLNLLMLRAPLFLVGVWAPTAEVGLFGAAQRTAVLTGFILQGVNSIAAPKFSALHDRGDHQALASVARRSTQLMTLLSLPILGVFVVLPATVMRLFGPGFEAGAAALAILAAGQFINVATGSVGYLLIMTGHERIARNNAAVGAVLTVALNGALVPGFGAVGAAIATSASLAIKNLAALVLVKRHLGIDLLIPLPLKAKKTDEHPGPHRVP